MPLRLAQPRSAGDPEGGGAMKPRVQFEPDGPVSVTTGKVELGQGILTALAQIAAEELGVPFERIRMLPASTAYSPDEGVTSGSLSVQEGGKTLRLACRELNRQKSVSLVGKSVPRLDLPAKIAGRPSYVHDMALPGMLYGRVVRPPKPFARLASIERCEGMVRDGSFVGVLAEREEQAIDAAAKLKASAVWEERPAAPQDFHAWLRRNVTRSEICKEVPDAAAKAAVKRLRATYAKQFVAHAALGPSCALACWHRDRLEVWTHSQGIFGLRKDLAMVLGMKEADIVVTHVEGAGCYGHNGADDVALDAALLARAAGGRPVKLQWMRDDEFAWEPYGAAMSIDLEAGLDAAGNIVAWRHELWSNGHTSRPGRADKPALIAAAHLAEPYELAPAVDPPLPAGGAQRNALQIGRAHV